MKNTVVDAVAFRNQYTQLTQKNQQVGSNLMSNTQYHNFELPHFHGIIFGKVTKNGAELIETNSGKALCKFSIGYGWKNFRTDSWETTYYKIIVWGRMAEQIIDQIEPGTFVIVAPQRIEGQFNENGKMYPEIHVNFWGDINIPKFLCDDQNGSSKDNGDDEPFGGDNGDLMNAFMGGNDDEPDTEEEDFLL